MNWLAHLALGDVYGDGAGVRGGAGGGGEVLLGSVMADFLRGTDRRVRSGYPAGVVRGIELHRRVDSLVDSHALVHRGLGRFGEAHRRVGGIVLDIVFDHFLTVDWGLLRGVDEDVEGFVRRVEGEIDGVSQWYSPLFAEVWPRMKQEGWLASYGSLEGVVLACSRLERRLGERFGRRVDLVGAVSKVECWYAAYWEEFRALWGDLSAVGRSGGSQA